VALVRTFAQLRWHSGQKPLYMYQVLPPQLGKVRTKATASEFASYNLCEDADNSAQKYTLAYSFQVGVCSKLSEAACLRLPVRTIESSVVSTVPSEGTWSCLVQQQGRLRILLLLLFSSYHTSSLEPRWFGGGQPISTRG